MDRASTLFILSLLEAEGIIIAEQKERMMDRVRRIPEGVEMNEAIRIIKEQAL